MAFVIADRVRETTTTTGTGTITLAGAVTNFETFTANLSNSDTTYYAIVDNTNSDFEVGLGTFTSSGTTLARSTIIASSNSNSAVDFGSGTKDVFITVPASKIVVEDGSNNVSIGGTVTATAFTDFSDLTFGSATITARGALIYNDSASGDPAVCVLDFGSDKSSSSGNFTIVFPTADSSNAIIRIA